MAGLAVQAGLQPIPTRVAWTRFRVVPFFMSAVSRSLWHVELEEQGVKIDSQIVGNSVNFGAAHL